MRRLLRAFTLVLVLLGGVLLPAEAGATTPYTLVGVFPGGAVFGVPDFGYVDKMANWQSKPNAVVNFFAGDPATTLAYMQTVWDTYHAVPMVSYQPTTPNGAVAQLGPVDTLALRQTMLTFLQGPDGRLNTADDRRAYLRYAWEPNQASRAHSPCNAAGGTAADYRQAWRRTHDSFSQAGITSTRMAWVFSVATGDCPQTTMESLYPGDAYVDWVGVDVYSNCGQATSGQMNSMVDRLRAISNKPMSVDEVGISSLRGNATKNDLINEYWNYVYAKDIRMSVWFNYDDGSNPACSVFSKPWAVFGSTYGDESPTIGGRQFWAFSAYRSHVAGNAWIQGANAANPRVISDRQFLGQD